MYKWQLVAVGVLEMAVLFVTAHLRTKIYTTRIAAGAYRNKKTEGTVLGKLNAGYYIPFPDVF